MKSFPSQRPLPQPRGLNDPRSTAVRDTPAKQILNDRRSTR